MASKRRFTTSSAAIFSATNKTVFPSAIAEAITLAIVWDLPVPGGPWITRFRSCRISCTASIWELSQSTMCSISAGEIWLLISSSSEISLIASSKPSISNDRMSGRWLIFSFGGQTEGSRSLYMRNFANEKKPNTISLASTDQSVLADTASATAAI